MGIARNVELYNQAFQLARDHIARDPGLSDRAGIVKDLHDAIRQELHAGVADPVAVAAGAIRKLQAQFS
ncbi:MAG TPA: hypothetical protein VFA53_00140 [Xanthobacteraceae bacterium]|nr:hypothetical protein [Xanthobacteraceae bacterium]